MTSGGEEENERREKNRDEGGESRDEEQDENDVGGYVNDLEVFEDDGRELDLPDISIETIKR